MAWCWRSFIGRVVFDFTFGTYRHEKGSVAHARANDWRLGMERDALPRLGRLWVWVCFTLRCGALFSFSV